MADGASKCSEKKNLTADSAESTIKLDKLELNKGGCFMRRKLSYVLLIFLVFMMVGCGKQDNLAIEDKLGKLSAKDLNFFIDSYKNNIYQSLYELDGEKYGRIISSSDSLEDAVRVCTRHFTDNRYPQAINTVVECNVIYESDILYGINVKWELTNNGKFDGRYEENVVSFKKNVADITVRNVIYDDVESYSICTNQEEQIKQIALYLYYNKNSIHHILNYETSYNDNEFIITIYAYHVIGGDWDLPSTYSFYKQTVVVDKTGDVNFQEPIVLKTVYK